MRINKYLASAGVGSRRKVEEYILDGKVTINGKIIKELGYDVKDNDKVSYNGKLLSVEEKKTYIMLNKPKCYITSLSDEKGRRIVTDLLKGVTERVFPIGRLDFNTEGLLLLTNDGDMANNIIHPSSEIGKTYEVKIKYNPTNKQLSEIRRGIVIDGKRTLPAKVEVVSFEDPYYILHVTIFEGRNREIRKMFEYLNLKIYNLKRISIGGLHLGSLEMGKYKVLSKKEINKVFMED